MNQVEHHKEETCGFEWGPARVVRISSDKNKGWVRLGIQTQKFKGGDFIEVYVTKTGKVKIACPRGEWKAPAKKGTK
jgi:hypothetical protein